MLIPVEAVLGHIEDACSALCASKPPPVQRASPGGFPRGHPLRWVGPEVKQPLAGLATSRTTDIEFPAINKRCLGSPASPEQSLVRHDSRFTIGLALNNWEEVDAVDLAIARQRSPARSCRRYKGRSGERLGHGCTRRNHCGPPDEVGNANTALEERHLPTSIWSIHLGQADVAGCAVVRREDQAYFLRDRCP